LPWSVGEIGFLELIGNWLVILGLLNPLGTLALAGTMARAAYQHILTAGLNVWVLELVLLHLEESLALLFNGPGAFPLMQAWGVRADLRAGSRRCCTRNGSTRWLQGPHSGDHPSEGLPPGRLSGKRRAAAYGFAALTRERAQTSHIALQFS
jgi:hypothetical protein